jgi:hypothetical protein
MAQSALNGSLVLEADTWTLISEINCTFTVEWGKVEILGMDGAAPASTAIGIRYHTGQGEAASTDTLSRFPGAGTPDRLYAISRGRTARMFISRAAVS